MKNSFSRDHENAEFHSKIFGHKPLDHHTFTNCTFHKSDFSNASLCDAKFCDCTFVGCNLSLVKLDGCRFQDVQFKECKLIGADFFKCEKRFFSTNFENTLIRYCNFSDLNMKSTVFNSCQVKESHFTNTCLRYADFNNATCDGTLFHNCDLTHANFSTATLYDIDPRTNNIKDAKFSLPEAARLLNSFNITLV